MSETTFTRPLSRSDRLKAAAIGLAGYAAIEAICRTIRWTSIGDSYVDDVHRSGKRAIFTIWHGRIFPAAYHWKGRSIVMLASMNRDAEAMAQCIARFGFGTARGSSSRGGMQALAEMARAIQNGHDVGFTVDGPRGPRYVAKPGPILLAMKTGAPILCTHLSLKHKIQLKSWDGFQVPRPFTSAVVLKAPPIWVPEHSSEDQIHAYQKLMQQTMDDLQVKGDSWWKS